MTEQEYLNSLKTYSPTFGYSYNQNLHFDSNKIDNFTAKGIDMSRLQNNTHIDLNNATFDDFSSPINENKTVNMIADNISYINSKINVGANKNYNGPASFSNVSLITADGVTFNYLVNGYSNNHTVDNDSKNNVVRTINMNNSGLGATETAIKAGNIMIENKSNAANSNIKIANSIIKGVKMENTENGDIYIKGSYDVEVKDSRLETQDTLNASGVALTQNQAGGEIYINGGHNATVDGSLLYTTGAKATANSQTAGNIKITSGNKTTIKDNARVIGKGNVTVNAGNNIEIADSIVQAENLTEPTLLKNTVVQAPNEIKITNAAVHATGDVKIQAIDSNKNATGNIIISADELGKTLVRSENNLVVFGQNTKLDDAALAYQDLKLYNDGSSLMNGYNGTNNLTIKDDTAFSHFAENTVLDDLSLTTNGNITLEDATVKRAATRLYYDRTADGYVYDDKTTNGIVYHTGINGTADAVNLTLTSTEGNIKATEDADHGKTNVNASQSITLNANADGKSVEITKGSTFTAGKDLNVNAQQGSIYITDNSTTTATNDVNLKSKNSITFGTKGDSNVNIDNSSNISAGHDINVTSLASDINAEKTTMPTLTYGNRLKFDAKGNNNFTSNDSLKSVNVDYVAGGANNITTTGDMQFVNSTLKAPNNNIKATGEGGDIILNNLEIKVATADAKDTVTNIEAKGDVTTVDVTGTYAADSSATSHTYPNSVSANRTGNTDTTLDVNGTKLKVHTTAKQTADDPDLGSITLKVADTSTAAGIELTAENYDNGSYKYDNNPGYTDNGTSYGPVVTLKQGDSNPVAVSKIVTDKLVLGNTKIKAASVNPDDLPAGTLDKFPEANQQSPKGVIVVRDYMGFDQDNDFTKNDPEAFDYDSHYEDIKIQTIDGQIDGKGKHIISYDNPDEKFLLVYDRPTNDCPNEPIITDRTHQSIDDLENNNGFNSTPAAANQPALLNVPVQKAPAATYSVKAQAQASAPKTDISAISSTTNNAAKQTNNSTDKTKTLTQSLGEDVTTEINATLQAVSKKQELK